MQTAAIYARVSTDWQAEHGYSLETQVSACEKYAANLGAANVTKYIDDGYSGAYLDRPRLDALRDALQAKIYDCVIVYTPDRLARRLSHQLLITEEIEKSGATLHFVNAEYKTTPEGQLFYQMQGAFAEYEREKIKERTMRGKRGKLKSGKPISDHGVFGYAWDEQAKDYIINEPQAAIIRKIFNMYISGDFGGTDALAVKLNEMNIPSPGGKKWLGSNVCRMLKKPMYTGEYYAYKEYSKKIDAHKRHNTTRPESEWIPMQCPAIVSKETFEAAQRLLDANKKRRKRKLETKQYLLQGVMKCARCGGSIVIRRPASGSYYTCFNAVKPQAEKCNARYAKTDIVDAAFWDTLKQICKTPKKLAAYIKATDKAAPRVDDTQKLKERLAKIDAEKAAIVEWYTSGYLTQAAATAKLEALTSEAKRIQEKLSAPKTNARAVDIARIYKLVKDCDGSFEAKKNIVHAIIDYITYERVDNTHKNGIYDIKFLIHFA
jgi:site-specific DNA recombinase